MKTIHFILATSISALSAFAVVQACGGQLTIGYDDAGNYHTADGAIWKPGGACVGWDASHYIDDAGFECDPSGDQCEEWLTPPGWFWRYTCVAPYLVDDAGNPILNDGGYPIGQAEGGTCAASFRVPGSPPSCDWKSDESEAFCTAWFEQFVTHGHVAGTCRAPGGPGTCRLAEVSGFTDNCDLGVVRTVGEGGIACVPPCAP